MSEQAINAIVFTVCIIAVVVTFFGMIGWIVKNTPPDTTTTYKYEPQPMWKIVKKTKTRKDAE